MVREPRPNLGGIVATAIGMGLMGVVIHQRWGGAWVRIVLGTPFVLLAPGCALQMTVNRRPFSDLVGTAMTMALSLALTVIVGVALDLADVPLTADRLLGALLAVCLAGCGGAFVRGLRDRRQGRGPSVAWRGPALGLISAPLLVGVALLGVIFAVARMTALQGYNADPVTQLWLLPRNDHVVVGVGNVSSGEHSYVLRVTADNGRILSRRITLAPGRTVSISLPTAALSKRTRIDAELFATGHLKSPIRSTYVVL